MLCTKDPLGALRKFDIIDCDRTRAYSRIIDEGIDRQFKTFDLDQFPFGETESPSDAVRAATNFTGQLAFVWANPWSKYYNDERILNHVKARLIEFADTQIEGCVVFGEVKEYEHFANISPLRNNVHIAWSIEPLTLAVNWIQDELSDDEMNKMKYMIRKSADLIMALPCNERNNRGAVRSAVLCLLGHFLKDRTLSEAGIHDFHRAPLGIFNPDGQVNEGPGPDGNYSGTSYVYCYTYRIFSGDVSIDEGVKNGARWYSWVSDSFGAPAYMGAATRVAITGPGKVGDFLPGMERYADEFPHFNWLVDNCYLRSVEKSYPGHIVNPLIYCMFEHNGEQGSYDPDWFSPKKRPVFVKGAGPEFRVNDEGTDSLYLVMRRGDNMAITTLIGRFQYKGLQQWNYKLEPPVFWPTMSHASRTRAFGVDTSRMRVSGSKFTDRRWIDSVDGLPDMNVSRVDDVMHHYVQTDTSLIYMSSCNLEPREDIFVIDPARCGDPIIEEGVVRYEGREGRMYFAGPQPELVTRENGLQLTFTGMGCTGLYVFSNESFERLEFNDECLKFKDDTGSYVFRYSVAFFTDDDMPPMGDKGLGKLFLSKQVTAEIERA
jgi:hypothetical protein